MTGIKASTVVLASAGTTTLMVALGALAPIELQADGQAPDWIMVLPTPAGGVIATVDGRGPYTLTDPRKLAADSLQAAGGRMPIDETHATDLAAPEGRPAPARGWIVALEARADGIYGRVEWNESGRQLIADKAYRGISPALACSKANQVLRILRASLTNTPNLRGMAALHQAEETSMLKTICAALGIAEDSDEAAVLAAIEALKKKAPDGAAMQAVLLPIAKAAGLKDGADGAAVLQAVTTLATKAKTASPPEVVANLQTELATMATRLNAVTASQAKDKATAFVDGEIAKGRVGVKPNRDHYIEMHAADPARVEKEIGALPIVTASGAHVTPPANKDGKIVLSAEQEHAAKLLGIKPDDYAKTLAAEQAGAA